MTLDPKAGERQARGARARELMNSPMFGEVIEAVEKEYRDAMFATRMEDGEKREALYAEYNGFRRLLKRLVDWENDGEMASLELEAVKEGKTNV